MIINLDRLLENQTQETSESFNLGDAIRSNKVDIIFCGNADFDEVLNEIAIIKKEEGDNIKLMVRNSDDMSIHAPTIKIQYSGCPIFDGRKGIPILFDTKNKDWYVYLGKSNKKKSLVDKYEKALKKEKEVTMFLDTAAKEIGYEISEYSKCKQEDSEKMNKLISSIKTKYYVEDND